MNWLDIVLALIVVASVTSGIARGFARSIVGIIAVIAGLILAIWCYGVAGSFLLDYVSHKSVANFIGFVVVFSIVVAAGALAGKILAKLFKWVGLGWLDRLMGGGLGFVRGVLVAMGIVLLLCAFSRNPPPRSVVESRAGPYLIDASGLLATIAPRELRDGFDESYQKARKVWEEMWRQHARKLPTDQL